MSRTNAQDLTGTSVLVTGGGSGIGLLCARRLAADRASVTIVGRSQGRLCAGVEAIEAAAAVNTGATGERRAAPKPTSPTRRRSRPRWSPPPR